MGKMLRGRCPECGVVLSARQSSVGSVIRCKNCNAKIHVEEEEADAPAKKKQPALSGCCGVVVLLGLFAVCGLGGLIAYGIKKGNEQARAELAEAHKTFDKGDKAAAVIIYKKRYLSAPDEDRPVIIKRVAEFEAEKGDEAEARKWIEKGITAKLSVSYDGPAARLYAQAKAGHDAEEARKKAEQEAKAKEREEQAKGLQVTAAQLRSDYLADKAAADRKYKGKTLRVSGTVSEVFPPEEGAPDLIVHLEPFDQNGAVTCWFASRSDRAGLALRKGQQVTIKGHCYGMPPVGGEVRLTGCSVVP